MASCEPFESRLQSVFVTATTKKKRPVARIVIIVAQLVVTVGLLAVFFHDPEFRAAVADGLRRANPNWIWIGVAVAGIENLLGVFRWQIILHQLRIPLPFWKTVQICLVALFCNTFLLGAAGGDLVRAAYLIRRGVSKSDALLSVMLDRIAGLLAIIVISATLVITQYEWLMESPVVRNLIGFVLAYQVIAGLLVAVSLFITAKGWSERLPRWAPFRGFAVNLGSGYAQFALRWKHSLAAVGISFFMSGGYYGVFWCASEAFEAGVTFVHFATVMPTIDIICALPISIGGVGVREKLFVTLLGQLTATPAAMAVSISLIGYMMTVSWGLVGAAMFPFFRGIVREANQPIVPKSANDSSASPSAQ